MSRFESVLGFDYGLARIGVALCQLPANTITPLRTVSARDGKPNWPQIEQLLQEWQATHCVVGLPKNMDGSDGPITARAERFARQLEGRFALSVSLVDERLSSVEAHERRLAGTNKAGVDAYAAGVILESWLAAAERR